MRTYPCDCDAISAFDQHMRTAGTYVVANDLRLIGISRWSVLCSKCLVIQPAYMADIAGYFDFDQFLSIYPALGYVFGHIYPHAPVFGVAPCPLLIFTFGVLLFTTQRPPACLFMIPALWAVVGLSAATALRVPQDFALIISAVATIVMLTIKHRRDRRTTAPQLTDAVH